MFSEAILRPLSRVVISVGAATSESGKAGGNFRPGKVSYKGGAFEAGFSPISQAKKPPFRDELTAVAGTARRGPYEDTFRTPRSLFLYIGERKREPLRKK
jgi:hypothetical protein